MVGLLEECKRLTQTPLSRVTDDQRSNLTDSIIQLSEKDQIYQIYKTFKNATFKLKRLNSVTFFKLLQTKTHYRNTRSKIGRKTEICNAQRTKT